ERPMRTPRGGGGGRDLDLRHVRRSLAQGRARADAPARQDERLGAEIRAPPRRRGAVSAIDYEAEYNNRARVPEHPGVMAGWGKDAADYRAQHPPRLLRYGSGERHRIDLFTGTSDGPIVVFIHGGYWQALDGSSFSHCARGLNAHGISVAVPTYDLCPAVSVGDIVTQMRMAGRELANLGQPLVVSGHSAGGHLAACMLATDWTAFDASLPKNR